ncbi:MAG: Crossover junction endodeoxyribonuclease RuvC [Microgenomates group bacterium GW2011_GWA1_48_10]|uniref:Crossover junction endodeoxyribonuclease RuvC n=1 Tax=Candidatus Gottesmanbacteria bacterium RIFCSPHIGHO2_01_FULL_47_48 TaxID=1798381 RepID=A0A1F6A4F5_9BACT|nr:MAG: Crossover junction endodeoxyribonuclease RuvC [Microgenomates group bacterium GW2011_GWA1_48_10]OGG19394.1 MAG: crossover junction endodeoxyribonuclease RuvC [Candidatus Gottesmanbacteria bacterium RIFCSPHIGHO2_01_FULL_47_48]
MKILGIDPGFARLGWGLIKDDQGRLDLIDFGCQETAAHLPEEERLEIIFRFLEKLITTHHPHTLAVEELFFAANAKTALAVGQSRGIVLLCAQLKSLSLHSYTPLQIKQALTGYGRADKYQIQMMVKSVLNLKTVPRPDDAADALAVAITHSFSYKMRLAQK